MGSGKAEFTAMNLEVQHLILLFRQIGQNLQHFYYKLKIMDLENLTGKLVHSDAPYGGDIVLQ